MVLVIKQPPPDRPHRDKRRRQNPATSSTLPPLIPALPKPSSQSSQPPQHQTRSESDPSQPPPANAAATDAERRAFLPQDLAATSEQQANGPTHSSPPRPPSGIPGIINGMDGTVDRNPSINREAGAAGEAVSAGPTITEDANGERQIISPGNQG